MAQKNRVCQSEPRVQFMDGFLFASDAYRRSSKASPTAQLPYLLRLPGLLAPATFYAAESAVLLQPRPVRARAESRRDEGKTRRSPVQAPARRRQKDDSSSGKTSETTATAGDCPPCSPWRQT